MALESIQLGAYRLLQPIGKGGMGEVYIAEDLRIPRQVAVKVVRNEAPLYPTTPSNSDAIRLFQREMKAIAALNHPNILPLLDFGEQSFTTSNFTYMVMPYCSEGSLVNWLHRRRPEGLLPPEEVAVLISQAADALQYAHNHGIIHLDVKASNFLVHLRETNPGMPHLLLADFGVARFDAATVTATQSIRGTPASMAPEQWAGNPVPATDQYALAVMAYQLLTGRTPFQGNLQQMMYQHLNEVPQPPGRFNPSIPAAVDAVILRALAKNPAERFPSIHDFAVAFVQAWQGTTAAFRQTSAFIPLRIAPQPPGSQPRTKLLAGLLALLAILLAVTTIIGGMIYTSSNQSASNQATATAQTIANGHITATAQALATAHAIATAQSLAAARATINAVNTKPVAITSRAGRIDLFVRGGDNALWHRTYDGTWHSWESLGGIFLSSPAVIQQGNRIDVFIRGSDNSLQHRYFDGQWHGWENLGGVLASDPAVVSASPGQMDVFVRGTNSGLYYRHFEGGTWSVWQPLGGLFASAPAAVSPAAGQIDVFVRGYINEVWHLHYDGQWHTWEYLGGSITSDPAVTTWGNGRIDIFGRGEDNILRHKWFDGIWHDWETLGSAIANDPAAVASSAGHIDLFVRGADNTIQHSWFDGEWHDWQPLHY